LEFLFPHIKHNNIADVWDVTQSTRQIGAKVSEESTNSVFREKCGGSRLLWNVSACTSYRLNSHLRRT